MVEGVTKFIADHTTEPLGESSTAAANNLIGWRNVLRRAQLIGIDPHRYGGVGYGNVSVRLDAGALLVSGTQTSAKEFATPDDFCRVTSWNLAENRVTSRGPVAPSSESMTHAMLYELSLETTCVLHVHSPAIWHQYEALGLPATPQTADYGTTDMAEAVRRLWDEGALKDGAFVMAGHTDGVVVAADSVGSAGVRLMKLLADALSLPGAESFSSDPIRTERAAAEGADSRNRDQGP